MFAQNIPNPNQRFVSEGGYITVPWHQFLLNLGAYAGGVITFPGSGITITNIVNAQQIALSEIATGMVLGNVSGVDAIPSATAFTFLNLTDTPNSYTSQALKPVRVNAGATALEFYALAAQDEGVTVTTSSLVTLNFTGSGVTASETSPGVVAVNVPLGAGGVTSVGISSTGATLAVSGSPITSSGTINLEVLKLATPRTFTFTGDATGGPTAFDGSANVSIALDLSSTGVTPGTYGDTTHVAQFTVDDEGRLSAAANVAITDLCYVPMSDGAEPPSIVSDGAGQFSFVPYSPP